MNLRFFTHVLMVLLAIPMLDRAADAPAPKNDIIVHPLVQQSLNYYGILLPPGYNDPANQKRNYPICVLLQGSGNTEEEYLDLVNQSLKRDGVIYLMPRAQYIHVGETLKLKTPKYTAWPEYGMEGATFSVPKDLQPKSEEIEKLYTKWIAECVLDAKSHYRVEPGKVALFGHSQGGAYGFEFAADHPELVKACFLAEGYYVDSRLNNDAAAKAIKDNNVHLVIIHNQDDPVVNFQTALSLTTYLTKNGVTFDHTFYPQGKHDISEPCKAQAAKFVDTWCRGAK